MLVNSGSGGVSSYRGGCKFEGVGLSRRVFDEYFRPIPSRLSGIGLMGIQEKVLELHARAWSEDFIALPVGGFYRYRRGGESHAWEAALIHTLPHAVAKIGRA